MICKEAIRVLGTGYPPLANANDTGKYHKAKSGCKQHLEHDVGM